MEKAPKPTAWLRSRTTVTAMFGFALSLAGALGGTLYVEPAQQAVEAASLKIGLQSARSRVILAATADANSAETLGATLFSVSLGDNPPDRVRAAVGDLMKRALERRHEATRAYVAELAVAGAVDFPAVSKSYEALVGAERADFNLGTYRAVNAFEAELAARMVEAQGAAAMKAITLQRDLAEAKAVAARRKLTLTLVSLAGSTIVFLAAMSGVGTRSPAQSAVTRLLAAAQSRLRNERLQPPDVAA